MIQTEQNELMEGDAKFWQNRFSKRAKSFTLDHEINAYSEHAALRGRIKFERVLDLLPAGGGGRALDIGCGAGVYSSILKKRGFEVYSTDVSSEMINVARKRLVGTAISFSISNVYHLQFKNETFDMITCCGLFQYLVNPRRVLSEITRVLKKEGILLVTTPNSRSLLWVLKGRYLNFNLHRRSFYAASHPFEFQKKLVVNGLSTLFLGGIYIFPNFLISLENLFEKMGIFALLDKTFLLSSIMAHNFIIAGKKINTKET